MRCVVTGALGFVGLNLVRRLAARGLDVIAVGRREPDEWVTRFLRDERQRVAFRVADLAVPGALQSALDTEQLDVLIHAAVITATTGQVERDASLAIVATNVGGTMEALDVARRHGVSRFVYVSSPSAIGNVAPDMALDENVETHPTTIYGITKRASEQLTRRYGEIHGLSTVSARIAQPYGPGERATPSRARTSPIQEWLVAASSGERLITGPVDVSRDWTHIDDTARGIELLATAPVLRHDLYHVNRAELVSVGEVVALLRAAFPDLTTDERDDAPGLNPNIAGPARRRPLDNSRFVAELGWAPDTGIDQGMGRYLGWWRSWRY